MREARKTGETARVGAGASRRFTLVRARGGAPSMLFFGNKKHLRRYGGREEVAKQVLPAYVLAKIGFQTRGLSIEFPGYLGDAREIS